MGDVARVARVRRNLLLACCLLAVLLGCTGNSASQSPPTTLSVWAGLEQAESNLRLMLIHPQDPPPDYLGAGCGLLVIKARTIGQAQGELPSVTGPIATAVQRAADACGQHPRPAFCLLRAVNHYDPRRVGDLVRPSLDGWPACNPRL